MTEETLTPQEMRRRLFEIAARGYDAMNPARDRVDLTSNIVRQCLRGGAYQGWSGEDTYTALAWHLLQAANRWGRMVHEDAVNRAPAWILSAGSIRGVHEWLPMDTAPKDCALLLRMPEINDAWAAGAWRGAWSNVHDVWSLHLPWSTNRKSTTNLLEGEWQPTGWMELPKA